MVFLSCFNRFSLFLKSMSVFFSLKNGFNSKIIADRQARQGRLQANGAECTEIDQKLTSERKHHALIILRTRHHPYNPGN